jgi:hypothetical protein
MAPWFEDDESVVSDYGSTKLEARIRGSMIVEERLDERSRQGISTLEEMWKEISDQDQLRVRA